jgi:dihydrofolate synthase/folylpolyglutamate synthase
VAVVEVGLGGRLDSTNVITPEVSVITNISFDHKDLLGDTLEKIAGEKAGIIKPGIPVVISERQPEVEKVFLEKAEECNSEIHFAQDDYEIRRSESGFQLTDNKGQLISELQIPLKGLYQSKNLVGVLKTIDILRQRDFKITPQNLIEGLLEVQQTGLKGRWQQLGEKPLMICDTGHNYAGVQEVVRQIELQRFKKLHIVWGMVKDKEPDEILSLLPKNAMYYFCQASIPRALEAWKLKEKAALVGLSGEVFPDVNMAIQKAKENAHPDDFIFIGGSTFVVAEIDSL